MKKLTTRNGKASLSAYLPIDDYMWLKEQAGMNCRSIAGQLQAMINHYRGGEKHESKKA